MWGRLDGVRSTRGDGGGVGGERGGGGEGGERGGREIEKDELY